MKAGSLQLMTISVLCESPRDRHLKEKCASKCVRGIVLSAFIYFLAQMDLRFETSRVRFEICNSMRACVAEQQKHPPSKSGGLHCPSWVRVLPHAPIFLRDVGSLRRTRS